MVELLEDFDLLLDGGEKVILVAARATDLQRRLRIAVTDRLCAHDSRHAPTSFGVYLDDLVVADGPSVPDVR